VECLFFVVVFELFVGRVGEWPSEFFWAFDDK